MNPSSAAAEGVAVGVTGGIACGKSEVGRILEQEGAAVRDADLVAHELMAPGNPVYEAVVARFGKEILGEGGALDRVALGDRVFADETERQALNEIVHPEVRRILRDWVAEITGQGRPAVAIIPLLFEVGETTLWSAVLCVAASETVVMNRLEARGLNEEDARARIRAQMPLEEKIRRADYVIYNEGTLQNLRQETLRVWNRILNKEITHHG